MKKIVDVDVELEPLTSEKKIYMMYKCTQGKWEFGGLISEKAMLELNTEEYKQKIINDYNENATMATLMSAFTGGVDSLLDIDMLFVPLGSDCYYMVQKGIFEEEE